MPIGGPGGRAAAEQRSDFVARARQQREQASERTFEARDKDDNGQLSASEVRGTNRGLFGVIKDQAMIARYDGDGDRQISRDEFVRGREEDVRRAEDALHAKQDFRDIDVDENGEVAFDELFDAMIDNDGFSNLVKDEDGLGRTANADDVVEAFDSDNDGAVNEREFVRGMAELRENGAGIIGD